MRLWDEALDAWVKAGRQGPQPQLEAIPQSGKSKEVREQALTLYRQILDKYPKYERMDEVLYNLGSSLYESGEKKKGVSMYWKLIKQFKSSIYAPDAWLQLGEHFFNANKLTQSIKAYNKAAE